MSRPTNDQASLRLEDSFALDDLWRTTVGLPEGDSKEKALVLLAEVLEKERVHYAIIGGVAIQVWTEEPRTTRDIDVALAKYSDLPVKALEAAGFEHVAKFEYSDNWRAPGRGVRRQRTAVQFSAGRLTPGTVDRSIPYDIFHGPQLLVAALPDLLRLKFEAALEPRRRASKRISDFSDIRRLIEEHPRLASEVSDLRHLLEQVQTLIAEDTKRL